MRNVFITSAGAILALMTGLASAQGDGGSQTKCELRFSTCKQTADADYQFCKTASGKNCEVKRDAARKNCSAANTSCQNSAVINQ